MNEFDRFWGFPYGTRRVPIRRSNQAAHVDLRARAAAAAEEREAAERAAAARAAAERTAAARAAAERAAAARAAAEREAVARVAAEREAAARARVAGAQPVSAAQPAPGFGAGARPRPVVEPHPWGGQRAAAAEPWSQNQVAEPAAPAAQVAQAVVPEPAPAGPAAASTSAGENALLRQEIERLTALVEEKDRLAREAGARASDSAGEVERAKERLRKEAARELERHKRDVVLGFIDVLDDLDRAAKAAQGESDAAAVREGVELVRKNFHGKLAQLGVEHAPSLGDRFDPAQHEAVSMLPIRDPAQDGVVVAVAREGYRMGDDVIRPARVIVARAS